MPDENLSIHAGAIVPVGKYRDSVLFMQLRAILEGMATRLKRPSASCPDEVVEDIFNGTASVPRLADSSRSSLDFFREFDGIVKILESQTEEDAAIMPASGAASSSRAALAPSVTVTV